MTGDRKGAVAGSTATLPWCCVIDHVHRQNVAQQLLSARGEPVRKVCRSRQAARRMKGEPDRHFQSANHDSVIEPSVTRQVRDQPVDRRRQAGHEKMQARVFVCCVTGAEGSRSPPGGAQIPVDIFGLVSAMRRPPAGDADIFTLS